MLFLITFGQYGTFNHHLHLKNILQENLEILDVDEKLNSLEHLKSDIRFNSNTYSNLIKKLLFSIFIFKHRSSLKNKKIIVTYFIGCSILCFFIKDIILDVRTFSISKNKLRRKLEDLILNIESLFFSKVFVLSNSMKMRFWFNKDINLFPLGSPHFKISKKDISSLNFFYIGTFNQRNISNIILAFDDFSSDKDDTFLHLIGRGKEFEVEKILDLISNTNSKVKFYGEVSFPENLKYYEKFNVGIAHIPATDYFDKQPATKMIEYLCAGMITMATKTSENVRIYTQSNDNIRKYIILYDDNLSSIISAMNVCYSKFKDCNYELISNSYDDYLWENIINQFVIDVYS